MVAGVDGDHRCRRAVPAGPVGDRLRTGFALNGETSGLRSLAAPVRDRSGAMVAAVGAAVHLRHLTVWNAPLESVMSRLEAPLRRATTEILIRLGHRPQAWSEAALAMFFE